MRPDVPLGTQFVDRAREMKFLAAAADNPGCRGVLVLGSAGIGKTSLIRIFANRLADSGRHATFASLRQYPNTEELFLRLNRITDEQSPREYLTPRQVQELSPHSDLQRSYGGRLISELANRLSATHEITSSSTV